MKERMLYMRREPASSAAIIYLLVAGLALLPTRWLGELFYPARENYAYMLGLGAVRLILFFLLALLARQMGIRGVWLPAKGERRSALLYSLPAVLIAVNNFPLVALIRGTAGVADAFGVLLFAVECIGVGLFEEAAFRAIIFPFVLGKTGTGRRGRVIAVLVSSAMFGALHLVNLLSGFNAGVFLQIGLFLFDRLHARRVHVPRRGRAVLRLCACPVQFRWKSRHCRARAGLRFLCRYLVLGRGRLDGRRRRRRGRLFCLVAACGALRCGRPICRAPSCRRGSAGGRAGVGRRPEIKAIECGKPLRWAVFQ